MLPAPRGPPGWRSRPGQPHLPLLAPAPLQAAGLWLGGEEEGGGEPEAPTEPHAGQPIKHATQGRLQE